MVNQRPELRKMSLLLPLPSFFAGELRPDQTEHGLEGFLHLPIHLLHGSVQLLLQHKNVSEHSCTHQECDHIKYKVRWVLLYCAFQHVYCILYVMVQSRFQLQVYGVCINDLSVYTGTPLSVRWSISVLLGAPQALTSSFRRFARASSIRKVDERNSQTARESSHHHIIMSSSYHHNQQSTGPASKVAIISTAAFRFHSFHPFHSSLPAFDPWDVGPNTTVLIHPTPYLATFIATALNHIATGWDVVP